MLESCGCIKFSYGAPCITICSFQMLTCCGSAGYYAGGYDPGVDWSSISAEASNTGELWVFHKMKKVGLSVGKASLQVFF